MTSLPCTREPQLFDLVLFDDVAEAPRADARHRAAALCAACPRPCDERVTAATQPRTLVLLPDDYMPPAAEGRRAPEMPQFGGRRRSEPQMVTGWDYVKPHQRVAAWTRMAGELATAGRSVADIAVALAVDEATAARLIAASAAEQERAA